MTRCSFDRTTHQETRANLVQESQTAICSILGTNQMAVAIDGCVTTFGSPEGLNRCSGKAIPGAGAWLTVSQGFLRSWHGSAQTHAFIDDAYNYVGAGEEKSFGGRFNYGTRVFFD